MIKKREVPFVKMHGNGNDFVIIENTNLKFEPKKNIIRSLSDRFTGIGFDQLILLSKQNSNVIMRIFNSDGSEAEMCGNASKCVGSLLLKTKNSKINIKTKTSMITAKKLENSEISIEMPIPEQNLKSLNITKKINILNINLSSISPKFKNGIGVNMGNPHIVFICKNVDEINLKKYGKMLENNKLFKKGINVEVVEIISKNKIKVRFWERGAGLTKSCGSGIYASFYACYINNKCNKKVKVLLPIGSVQVSIEKNLLLQKGKVNFPYHGKFFYG